MTDLIYRFGSLYVFIKSDKAFLCLTIKHDIKQTNSFSSFYTYRILYYTRPKWKHLRVIRIDGSGLFFFFFKTRNIHTRLKRSCVHTSEAGCRCGIVRPPAG